MGDDPETLLRFSNVNYAEPAWFVRPEEPDTTTVVLFEDIETTDELSEPATVAADAQSAADSEVTPPPADPVMEPVPQSLRPAAGDQGPQEPLSPEERRALALAAAEAKLAERIELDRVDLAAQTLRLEDALKTPEGFPLNSAMQRIERVPGMQVLFAGSWLTEPTPRDALAPLWLQVPATGIDLIADPDPDATTVPGLEPQRALELGVLRAAEREPEGPMTGASNNQLLSGDDQDLPPAPPRHPLEGTIAISKGRYLHAALQLVFDDPLAAPPDGEAPAPEGGEAGDGSGSTGDETDLRAPLVPPPAVPAATPLPLTAGPMAEEPVFDVGDQILPTLVHLAQRRRMKSGELHYIDHPRLGVLIRIDPIEIPAETAAVIAQVEALQRLNR